MHQQYQARQTLGRQVCPVVPLLGPWVGLEPPACGADPWSVRSTSATRSSPLQPVVAINCSGSTTIQSRVGVTQKHHQMDEAAKLVPPTDKAQSLDRLHGVACRPSPAHHTLRTYAAAFAATGADLHACKGSMCALCHHVVTPLVVLPHTVARGRV